MLLRLYLVLVAVVVCWAKKPCCFPAQWEGKAVSGVMNSRKGAADLLMPKIAVDFTNGKFAVHELVVPRGRHGQEDMHDLEVLDEDEDSDRRRVFSVASIGHFSRNHSVLYIIFPKHKKCITKRLRASPKKRRHCIPEKAKFSGSVTIGGDRGVSVDRWVMRSRIGNATGYEIADYIDDYLLDDGTDRPKPRPHPRGVMAASVVVSSRGCVPVSEHIFKADRKSRAAMGAFFFDIKGGIKDPDVFNPPSYCRKSDEYDVIDDMEATPLTEYFVEKFQ